MRRKEDNIPGDQVIQLSCNKSHIFHSTCLQEWLKMQFRCPICREVVISTNDKEKLERLNNIVKRNILIQLQNDED